MKRLLSFVIAKLCLFDVFAAQSCKGDVFATRRADPRGPLPRTLPALTHCTSRGGRGCAPPYRWFASSFGRQLILLVPRNSATFHSISLHFQSVAGTCQVHTSPLRPTPDGWIAETTLALVHHCSIIREPFDYPSTRCGHGRLALSPHIQITRVSPVQ